MAYEYRPGFGAYQPPQGAFPYQPTNYSATPQNTPTAPQAAPQQGFSVRPVASREEAMAVQTDFFGPGIILPNLGQGVIFLKRFNPNTGASDLLEFVYAPPQAPKQELSGSFVSIEMFQQLAQKVEALEKGGLTNVSTGPDE